MTTFVPPKSWPPEFTNKYWQAKKSPKVKKTGVGERLDKAQKLFEKIKWDLFDASKAKPRLGHGPIINKLAASLVAPIQKLIDEIIARVNNAARDTNADDNMVKLCEATVARANLMKQLLQSTLDEALALAAELDAASDAFAKSRKDFTKSFATTLKGLEAEAKTLAAQVTKVEKCVLAARQQSESGNNALADKAAALATSEITAALKTAADIQARRSQYQGIMDAQRNLIPGAGLTVQDMQIHDSLTKMVYALFKHFDVIYGEIKDSANQARKLNDDLLAFADKNDTETTKWRKIIQNDIASLRQTLERLKSLTTSNWGSQISQKGEALVKTANDVAKKIIPIPAGIKTCEQAEAGMSKALQFVRAADNTLQQNYLKYKAGIPTIMATVFPEDMKTMSDILQESENILSQFVKDYDISMKKLETLKKIIAKLTK